MATTRRSLFFRIVRADDSETNIKYLFATNMGCKSKRILKRYKQRWGVETSYRKHNEFLARTTSKNYVVRLLFYSVAVCIYNCWCLLNALQGQERKREDEDEHIITLEVKSDNAVSVLLPQADMNKGGRDCKMDGVKTCLFASTVNALDVGARKEIISALDLALADEKVRAVVLTGAGEKAFSAGADLKMFLTMTPFQAKKYLKVSKGASAKLESFPKPVIAAVNGYAIGGGLELAMSCDIIIASENARFGQSELNVGVIPGVGGTQRLPRLVGVKRAKEMIFTGEAHRCAGSNADWFGQQGGEAIRTGC